MMNYVQIVRCVSSLYDFGLFRVSLDLTCLEWPARLVALQSSENCPAARLGRPHVLVPIHEADTSVSIFSHDFITNLNILM